MLRTIKVAQSGVTTLVTGVEGCGIGDQGRVLGIRAIKPASFAGSHNRSKSVCLILLAHSMAAQLQGGWLSAKQLSELSGLSYGSVLASAGKWCRWRLIRRRTSTLPNGRMVYVYSIAPRGLQCLARHRGHMAGQLAAYDRELRQYRGYGFTEALGRNSGLSASYPAILEPEHDSSAEDGEEDY